MPAYLYRALQERGSSGSGITELGVCGEDAIPSGYTTLASSIVLGDHSLQPRARKTTRSLYSKPILRHSVLVVY